MGIQQVTGARNDGLRMQRKKGPIPAGLRTELEALGLNPNQARLLLGLLRLGPAKPPDLARVSGVPRTSIYPVLEELSTKCLAERVSGPGPAVWAACGRDEILDRLHQAEQERVREHEARTERVRELLAKSFPDESPAEAVAQAHAIRGMAEVRRAYERMLTGTETELVICTRLPHLWTACRPRTALVAMLDRGVNARVLYQASEWEDPAAEEFWSDVEDYHAAGVQPRLADDLPVRMLVSDRRMALVEMPLDTIAEDSYPPTLWIEHPGYAAIHADAFEHRWAEARPLPE